MIFDDGFDDIPNIENKKEFMELIQFQIDSMCKIVSENIGESKQCIEQMIGFLKEWVQCFEQIQLNLV